MNVLIIRNQFTENSTISDVMIDGEFFCFGLEPAPPVVPNCSYDLTLRWSDKFRRIMPHVEAVTEHVGIEIHTGNVAADTEGCLILGEWKGTDFVGNSHIAFQAFMEKLRSSEGPNYITYTGEKII